MRPVIGSAHTMTLDCNENEQTLLTQQERMPSHNNHQPADMFEASASVKPK